MKKIGIALMLVLIMTKSNFVAASEITENDIIEYFNRTDIAFQTKDYTKAIKLFSDKFSYYVYYPTVTPPDDERIYYINYIEDLKKYFNSDADIMIYKTEIIQFKNMLSQAFVAVRINNVVQHNNQVDTCYIPAFYFLKKENNQLVATKFDGVAECYQQ